MPHIKKCHHAFGAHEATANLFRISSMMQLQIQSSQEMKLRNNRGLKHSSGLQSSFAFTDIIPIIEAIIQMPSQAAGIKLSSKMLQGHFRTLQILAL